MAKLSRPLGRHFRSSQDVQHAADVRDVRLDDEDLRQNNTTLLGFPQSGRCGTSQRTSGARLLGLADVDSHVATMW
ncbi:MAG: hypothetical protein EA377_02585 [Phycisphaerales bacterium]|nr:MAG: hypothetical protein EA377_02585 [Phycisphaerales bacterium]